MNYHLTFSSWFRYDCRGALSDLNPYLPKSDVFDRRAGLSNEEKRIEALCDEERFRALNVNEEEEILYQGISEFSFRCSLFLPFFNLKRFLSQRKN